MFKSIGNLPPFYFFSHIHFASNEIQPISKIYNDKKTQQKYKMVKE
jgi:hypothetical protein